ncbi:MAG: sensor histidine kinase [Chloroflexota bacterium]
MNARSRAGIFLQTPAWRAVLEAWAGVLLYIFLFTRFSAESVEMVFGSPIVDAFPTGLLMVTLLGTFWVAVRTKPAHAGWWQRLLRVCTLALVLGAVLSFGAWLPAHALGWLSALAATPDGEESFALPIAIVALYPWMRLGVHTWVAWRQRSRRSMVLWLANTILAVVASMIFGGVLLLNLVFLIPGIDSDLGSPYANFPFGLVRHFFVMVVPSFLTALAAALVILLILLPFAVLFSFLIARRTTRRVAQLAQATAAFCSGYYTARVPVDGEDEVARLQADFNAMAEQLASTLAALKSERDTVTQVLQARRDLVASVSHELRTPVATLRAAVETTLAQEAAPTESLCAKLELMEKEIQRLSGLIDDLFVLSQAEVDNLRVDCAPTALRSLVEQVIATFAPLAWQSGRVEVTAELPENLPCVQADAERLKQVLLNLLRNAVRYTPPGGVVAVLAQATEEGVRIEVRDTGEGIDPGDLPHIWERFYRGKNANSESAGLGLALVKELVEAMGGRVGVESVPSEGSCFIVLLRKG